MTLSELIEQLKKEDPSKIVVLGFGSPHSYRGYYDELAFEPKQNVSVGEMLKDAEFALGHVFTGYKGGEFRMNAYTECWLAEYGNCGETIGAILLGLLLRQVPS